jgi:hypothetical protein
VAAGELDVYSHPRGMKLQVSGSSSPEPEPEGPVVTWRPPLIVSWLLVWRPKRPARSRSQSMSSSRCTLAVESASAVSMRAIWHAKPRPVKRAAKHPCCFHNNRHHPSPFDSPAPHIKWNGILPFFGAIVGLQLELSRRSRTPSATNLSYYGTISQSLYCSQ